MTTETRTARRAVGGSGVLARSALLALLVGAAVAALGSAVAGRPAALAALAGTGLAVVVLFGGSLAVEVVARVLPSASLLVALVTFLTQMVAMGAAFLIVSRSEAIRSTIEPAWLGWAVMAVTVTWMVGHVLLTMRRRIPLYQVEGGH